MRPDPMSEFSLKQVHPHPLMTIIEVDNPFATAKISLFGAQVLQYCPKHDQRERLFLSPGARLDASKSIRGGIPLCWPWFGAHPVDSDKPAHGFARTIQWRIIALKNDHTGTRLLLGPVGLPDETWTAQAGVELEILIADTLTVSVLTRNTGTRPLAFSAALHSYFAVSDISLVSLEGLQGDYSDKTRNWAHFATPTPYRFAGETDRIHLDASPEIVIQDPAGATRLLSTGHDSIVVWNPWSGCAQQFTDMPPDSYRHMLCVETALTRGFILPTGETHRLQQTII